ncbi:MAG: hypothetical protein Q7T77_05220 [Sulfuricurvum sp.]|nr:hypothetical protein [Sulfuricurvum sp.]
MKKNKIIKEAMMKAFSKFFPKKEKGMCETLFAVTKNEVKYDNSIFENFEVRYESTHQAR